MRSTAPSPLAGRLGMRTLAIACATIAVITGVLALGGAPPAWAQDESACEVTDLGTLSVEGDNVLQAEGRWTTEDCDSRFRIDSDAHTYRFQHTEGDRIRIDLISADGDSYLYLLAEDGSRIADNDDGGAALNARIERELAAGRLPRGGDDGRRARTRPSGLHAFHWPRRRLRAGPSGCSRAGRRPDRIRLLDARHVRLARGCGAPRARLLLPPAAGRSCAHRLAVGRRRPRPLPGCG